MCVSYHGKREVVTVTLPQNVLSFSLFSVKEQRIMGLPTFARPCPDAVNWVV